MGIETIIIASSIAVSIALTAYSMLSMPKSKQNMKQSISDLSVTRAEEGQCIPIVYGTVRVSGSIIWYGNVLYKPTKIKGAKGSGSSSSSNNYKVYVDTHIVLCQGKIELLETYKDEEVYTIEASTIFNDGTNGIFEAYDTYATQLPGIAHIFFKRWLLGENVYSVPSLSFKVKRILTTPLTSTVTTGENPACIIWDLLSSVGASLDESSFQTAANYFNSTNIGLNLAFNEQQEISKMLETIFSHVDLVLYKENGVYYLNALQTGTAAVVDIPEDDIKDLAFTRVSYNQVKNDFAANYIDEDNTQRTVRLINEAVYAIVGERQNHSYDFKGFNSLSVVQLRLAETLKIDSFPLSEITFKTSLKYYDLLPGDVFTLSYSLFQMVQKSYRIKKIERKTFSLEIEITARENVYDLPSNPDVYVGETLWEDIDFTPQALEKVHAIQMRWGKYREWTGKVPMLILPVKKTGREISYDVYFSRDGSSYELAGTGYTFATVGQLAEEYPANTYEIDDQHGMLLTYDEDASFYALDDLTRSELFTTTRMLVVESEAMKFQTATEEDGNLRLFGVLRDGRYQVTHNVSTDVFITEIKDNDNIIYLPIHSKLYIKVCPRTARGVLALSDAVAIEFTPDIAPEPPTRLKATRNGDDVTLEIFPNINANQGCGYGSPDMVTDAIPHPFRFTGSFLVQVDSDPSIVLNTTTYDFTKAGACDVTVWNQDHGAISSSKTLSIGADDGEYII